MINALLFDAYGTLFDTKDGSVRATGKILHKRGSKLVPADVYARWKVIHKEITVGLSDFITEAEVFRLGLRRIYEEFGITGDSDEDVSIMLAIQGTRVVYPDTVPAINALRKRYKVYVASNIDHGPLTLDLDRNGVVTDGSFSSELLGVYKPHREFYLRILEKIGETADNVMFVGDSPMEDIIAPASLGMHTAWVNRKGMVWDDAYPRPDVEVQELGALVEYLNPRV